MNSQTYVVTETYLGLSSLPSFDQPTDIPFGFTTRLETCEIGMCGLEAITATMTFPAGGGPFVGTLFPTGGAGHSDDECPSTLSTQSPDIEMPETVAVLAATPTPARPTVVISSGNILKRQFDFLWAFALLTAIL
jgi:hypothetical protein